MSGIILNTNLFLNDDVQRPYFYKASTYPNYWNKLTTLLKDLKFRDVQVEKIYKNLDEIKFLRPTLLILPRFEKHPINIIRFVDEELKKFFLRAPFSKHNSSAVRLFANHNFSISEKILEHNFEYLKYNNIKIGLFSNSRNCVILFFNPFATDKRIKFMEDVLSVLKRAMQTHQIQLKEDPNYLKKLEEDFRKKNIKHFLSSISNRIEENLKKIQQEEKSIIFFNTSVINKYREINLMTIENEVLENHLKNAETEFNKLFEDLKKLQFIKKIAFNENGILFDVGKIILEDCYIGDFQIEISATNIKFYNKHQMNLREQHPHVKHNKGCYGDASTRINKLLGNFKLRELLFLLYQFLNTYSDSNPFTKITEWKSFRTKENKFNSKSGLIKNSNI